MGTGRATTGKQDDIINQLTNPAALVHGKKVVAAAGVEESLSAAPNALKIGVTVKALEGNNGKVYVGLDGVSSANGFELGPSEQIFIPINDLELIFVDVDNNGEGVTFIAN